MNKVVLSLGSLMSYGNFVGEGGKGEQLSLLTPRRMRGHGPHSSCRVTGFPEEPSRSPTSSSIRPVITGPQLLGDSSSVPTSRF